MFYALGNKSGKLYTSGAIKRQVIKLGTEAAKKQDEGVNVYSSREIKYMLKILGDWGANVEQTNQ